MVNKKMEIKNIYIEPSLWNKLRNNKEKEFIFTISFNISKEEREKLLLQSYDFFNDMFLSFLRGEKIDVE